MDILRNTTIAVLFIVTAGSLALVSPSVAQISPGELAEPHAFLEGVKNCFKCHELGSGLSTKKCLDCHKEVAAAVENKHGYHYRMVDLENKTCHECHRDHAGRNFRMINWPGGINDFEHRLTGYELKGKHRVLKCRDCHNTDLIRENLSRFGDQVNQSRTFLGLHTDCLACHSDEHRGQLSLDCLRCHTYDGWKPVTDYNHQKTAYPLTGKHLNLACGKCHPRVKKRDPAWPGSSSFVQYKNISFANCTPCHKDVHKGNFGTDCVKCHNTADWRDIPEAAFDHSKTSYPLSGLHTGLACDKCHASKKKKAPLAHERCADCHRDIHFGQFANRPDKGACESCHTVGGFLPSLFTSASHDSTRFTLEGAHLAQACTDCHQLQMNSDGQTYRAFIIKDTRCISCHRDIHYDQFNHKDCNACHNVDKWQQISFNHNSDSNYKLEGQHSHVACAGCHVETMEYGNKFVRYRPINPACKTCHVREDLKLNVD